ncbi:MAG TPA: prepilin-type N-terminal cleavage/methylation domain-containing protein [Pyrinomonadaceae bacterium]|jgi:type IV pilus assembly protein PilA
MKESCRQSKGFSLIELLIVMVILGIIAAIAIPYLLHAKQAAHSASAVASLRLVHSSQGSYRQTSGVYGDMTILCDQGFINDPSLRAGLKSDYSYTVTPAAIPANGYTALATPASAPTIWNHYFVNETGVLRFEKGAAATSVSSPVQ